MDDNLTLDEDTRRRYERMFEGVFYQRNILGLWVTAEGKIYTAFNQDNILSAMEWNNPDSKYNYIKNNITQLTIGVDFGR